MKLQCLVLAAGMLSAGLSYSAIQADTSPVTSSNTMTVQKVAGDDENTLILSPTAVIKAVVTQKLVSDYPGVFRAIITHDVYDLDKQAVLIPAGSKALLEMITQQNINEPINNRVGFIAKSIIRPDGVVIDLTKDQAIDHEGVAGIKDEVNYHFMAQFLGVIAYAIVSSGADDTQVNGLDGRVRVEDEVKNSTRKQASSLTQKFLKLVPTITINPGTTFNIFIVEPKRIAAYRNIYENFIR